MGWIRWAGKALEFTGKIAQADSFEEWAKNKGEAVLEQMAVNSTGYVFGIGKKQKAKSDAWDDLASIAKRSPALHQAINSTVAQYPTLLKNLAGDRQQFPGSTLFGHVYAIPRFLHRLVGLDYVFSELSGSAELSRLKGGIALRDFFLEELVTQMDGAFIEEALKSSPTKPFQIDDIWIVGFDPTYPWVSGFLAGHYYIYSAYRWTEKKEVKEAAPQALQKLMNLLGSISSKEKAELTGKFWKPAVKSAGK